MKTTTLQTPQPPMDTLLNIDFLTSSFLKRYHLLLGETCMWLTMLQTIYCNSSLIWSKLIFVGATTDSLRRSTHLNTSLYKPERGYCPVSTSILSLAAFLYLSEGRRKTKQTKNTVGFFEWVLANHAFVISLLHYTKRKMHKGNTAGVGKGFGFVRQY